MVTKRTITQLSTSLLWASLMAIFCAGCSQDKQEAAVETLFQKDYAFTVNDFFKAASAGDAKAVRWFLDAGMLPNVDDGQENRALHEAAKAGSADAVKILIDHGAITDAIDAHKRSALIYATGSGNAESVRLLLKAGADPLMKDESGWSALSFAAHKGKERAVEMLAPVSEPVVDQALLLAARSGHTGVIDILLINRANIHVRGSDDYTPLMIAAKEGHLSAVQLLLDREADRFILNAQGLTAAQVAKQAGHDDIAALLAGLPTSSEISGKKEDPLALRDEQGRVLGLAGENSAHPSINGSLITAVPGSLKMKNYREHRMPVILNAVDADNTRAALRLLYGSHTDVEVAPGEEIPGSGLRVIEMRHRITQGKEGPRDASSLLVEDTATGERHHIASGQNARTIGTYALLQAEDSLDSFEARRGDEFTLIEGQGDGEETRCRVLDVRPDQVLIEDLDTGKVHTLPRH